MRLEAENRAFEGKGTEEAAERTGHLAGGPEGAGPPVDSGLRIGNELELLAPQVLALGDVVGKFERSEGEGVGVGVQIPMAQTGGCAEKTGGDGEGGFERSIAGVEVREALLVAGGATNTAWEPGRRRRRRPRARPRDAGEG